MAQDNPHHSSMLKDAAVETTTLREANHKLRDDLAILREELDTALKVVDNVRAHAAEQARFIAERDLNEDYYVWENGPNSCDKRGEG